MDGLRKIFSGKNRRRSILSIAAAFAPNLLLLFAYWLLIKAGVYRQHPELDNPLHVLSGMGIAWASFACWRLGEKNRLLPKLSLWPAVVFAVGIAAAIGVLWEAYEFLLCLARGWDLPEISDTIKDLINDILGAFTLAVFAGKALLGQGMGKRPRP